MSELPLPRAIDIHEVRAGMEVKVTSNQSENTTVTYQGPVFDVTRRGDEVLEFRLSIGEIKFKFDEIGTGISQWRITLISPTIPPAREAKFYSRWSHPETGGVYARTSLTEVGQTAFLGLNETAQPFLYLPAHQEIVDALRPLEYPEEV